LYNFGIPSDKETRMDLKGKTALITGGARIGAAVAVDLARAGARVALTYFRSEDSARKTLRAVADAGSEGVLVRADLRRTADLMNVVPTVREAFGGLDVLINMASVYDKTPLSSLTENPDAPWRENMDANLRHVYALTLAAAPLLRKNGRGRVVNFTDWVAASGRPRYKDYIPYYTAKAAVKGLTEALALELAPEILVNAVAPGPILPPPDLSAADLKAVEKATPAARWGGAGEIVKAVRFLIDTDFVTGETLRVDGGRHLL
jgi:NAD(P)-dependent dehydrogenase (short-subunit alcohol dehydrogenase family)